MADFHFDSDVVALPQGAWSKTQRVTLAWRGRDVLAFTQGPFRSYLYPLYTPAGFAVTGEGPADHPHHMRVTRGGRVADSEGRLGGERISGPGATWVDYSGPVGGGRRAGIAVLTRPDPSKVTWFVYDWGTVTANPFFPEGRLVRMGEAFTFDVRLVVHDGDASDVDLGRLYRQYVGEAV